MSNGLQDLLELLGKPIESPAVKAAVNALGPLERKTVVDRHYFKFPANGISIATDEGMLIETIFLYGEERDGFSRYGRKVPHDIRFEWDRQRVRAAMGQPSVSGGGEEIPFYGPAARWDRYDFPRYSLHLEYRGAGEGQGVSMMTLTTPEATPGRDVDVRSPA